MGKIENLHAEPFADALEKDPTFGFWLLRKTVFADFADEARLLNREMLAKRSPTAKNWWQSVIKKNPDVDVPDAVGEKLIFWLSFKTRQACVLRFILK